jgi:hypothetical protein
MDMKENIASTSVIRIIEWIVRMGLILVDCQAIGFNGDVGESCLSNLIVYSRFCKSIRMNLVTYWEFQHYKPMIKGCEEDGQNITMVMNQLGLEK